MKDLVALAPNVGVVTALVGTILAVFRAVYTGGLVPRQTHQDVINDRDQWRKAHEISESARFEQKAQVDDLLELAKTSNALLTALNRVREHAP